MELAAKHGAQLEGAITWAFTFADQPYLAGFRQVATNGLPLAVFNVFRMFARMGSDSCRHRAAEQSHCHRYWRGASVNGRTSACSRAPEAAR